MKKIAVIGAGPAGMFAAISAAQNGAQVDLYDHNEKIGKKLFITGKGRCNVTNAAPIENFFDNIPRNKSFLYSSLYSFTNDMLMDLIEANGCKLKVERGNRVFPASDKSSDIIKVFKRLLDENKVNVILNTHVKDLYVKDDVCLGIIVNGKKELYESVIICSGGVSYQSTGSDGSLFSILKKHGHNIISPEPVLVGLTTKETWPRQIAGLTLKNVGLKLYKGDKLLFKEQGECLITHTGISGPIVLSASSYIEKPYKDYHIYLDLKPALSPEKLDQRILRDFQKNINKDFQNSLNELLPKNLIPIIIDNTNIPKDLKVNSITKEQRQELVNILKKLPLKIVGKNAINTAIVTRGGVDTNEINPNTLESKIIKNLYFAGEVIDVDALTGGFNIQIAVSTGYLAGISS